MKTMQPAVRIPLQVTRIVTVLVVAYILSNYMILLGIGESFASEPQVFITLATALLLPVLPLVFQPFALVLSVALAYHTFNHRVRCRVPVPMAKLPQAICLVTGATKPGIGFEIALGLARSGATLVITGVLGNAVKEAVVALRRESQNERVYGEVMDLSIKNHVHRLAKRMHEFPRLDVLVNNAGVLMVSGAKSAPEYRDIDYVMAVNFAGPFLLTRLLGPLILKSPAPRIVNLSSSIHRLVPSFEFSTLTGVQPSRQKKMHQYSQSKLAVTMFTACLRKQGLHATCVHPGFVRSQITRHMPESVVATYDALKPIMHLWDKSAQEGAAVALALAVGEQSGDALYYGPNGEEESHPDTMEASKLKKLWEAGSELVGLQP